MQMLCHLIDILHHLDRLFKHERVHLLHDVAFSLSVIPPVIHTIRSVDISNLDFFVTFVGSGNSKGCTDLFEFGIHCWLSPGFLTFL